MGVFVQEFVEGGAPLWKDFWIYFDVQRWRVQQWFGMSLWKQESCGNSAEGRPEVSCAALWEI